MTKDEFEQLLQRAAERHTLAAPGEFTVEELVEAGGELGLDAATVRQVFDEHQRALARSAALPPVRPRPNGSKVQLAREGDTMILDIPPTATMAQAVVMIAVMGGALVFATVMGAPRMVSAILAVGGLLLSYICYRVARTRYQLRLRRDGGGQLLRFVGDRAKGIELHPGQVHARLDSRMEGDEKKGYTKVTFVALDHGTETHELCEGLSHPEQAWVVEEIEHWLGRAG